MKKRLIACLQVLLVLILASWNIQAQNVPATSSQAPDNNRSDVARPSFVGSGTFLGVSPALRDIPPVTQEEINAFIERERVRTRNPKLRYREYPNAGAALPKGADEAWQKEMGTNHLFKGPLVNFPGQLAYSVPDDNGAAGPKHYMQTVNCTYAIYSKTGELLAGPTDMNKLFGNVPGAQQNDGDAVVYYDDQADRWLAAEFSLPAGATNYILVAVSTTNDPTGTWNQYSFPADPTPDYPKLGVWRDGYYVGVNSSGNNEIYVYERSKMLAGESNPKYVAFKNPNRPGPANKFMVVPPVDTDGPFAPEGWPGLFIAFNDDAWGGKDQLWIFELAVNWSAPTTSTFSRVQQIDVTPFSSDFGPTWENIRQKGTSQEVDAVSANIMNPPQFRNFGTYQTILCCHSVRIDSTYRSGVRWYELRKAGADWSIRQQGTYAPDTNSRWLGSIMLNGKNAIGLGYSVSSAGEYPGIRFCGQSPTAYLAGNSVLDITEDTIHVGTMSQNGSMRWGDYSAISIDPTDDETFWYTNQFIKDTTTRGTRIASFKIKDPSGIDQPEAATSRVRIYPNPTKGVFRIVPQQSLGLVLKVCVEDQSGKTVMDRQFSGNTEYVMDLSQAQPGIYNIVMRTDQWKEVTKLVIAR